MGSIFFEITVVICIASFLAIVFKLIKQPLILAYILTGVLVGPFGIIPITNKEVVHWMGELGITLLLFMLGLELRLSELRSIGVIALIGGSLQMVVTMIFGFFLSSMFGFSVLTSVYFGIVLAFSSTIIVVKILSDKKDLKSLYGKITVGVLLVQDFVAILSLVLLSGFKFKTGFSSSDIYPFVLVLLQAFFLFALVMSLSIRVLPVLVHKVARSSETLFLFSLAWVLGVAAIVTSIGFSIEIGGLLAGLSLANSLESYQIVARIRALRDFFITLFFVYLGSQMIFSNFYTVLAPVLLFSLFVLVGKPLIVMTIFGVYGYRKSTSFLSGITLGQISEFSLVVMFLGKSFGHVSDEAVSIITMVGVITFVFSAYAMQKSHAFLRLLNPFLDIFERSIPHKEQRGEKEDYNNHIVLVGANRTGGSILGAIHHTDKSILVVDFDPDVVKELSDKGIRSLFGDISDLDIQERAQLEKARLVVSTVPDVEDNLRLAQLLRNEKVKIVVIAQDTEEAKELYEAGVDYVVLPHIVGGRHIARLLQYENFKKLHELREREMKTL